MKKQIFKVVTMLLAVVLLFSLVACNKTGGEGDKTDPTPTPATEISVMVPDGTPALALAQLMAEKPTFDGYNISYKLVSGAPDISTAMASGKADIAIMPTNLASILHNKVGASAIATSVQGILYMVGNSSVTKVDELVGKVVYNIGQGGTPDTTFKAILDKAGVAWVESATPVAGKVALNFVDNGSTLLGMLVSGKAEYGIMGEPVVSTAVKKGLKVSFGIQDLWKEYGLGTSYPQTALVVSKKIMEECAVKDSTMQSFLKWFVTQVSNNDAWVLANPAEAGTAIASYNSASINANITAETIKNCNIDTTLIKDAKAGVTDYLQALYNSNPSYVGGAMPSEAFYFDIYA